MKRTGYMAATILIVLGVMTAHAQSLGDYAKSARATKTTSQATANHHYDNDNLPRETQLNVVGQAPAATADAQASKAATPANGSTPNTDGNAAAGKDPKDQKTATDEHKKADEALQGKITEQKQKIATLSQDLDLTQREYRLRAAAFYADAGNRLRNSGQWDKDDAQYKQQIADKQKALDAAKTDLEAAQEAARKAGIPEKDNQKDNQ